MFVRLASITLLLALGCGAPAEPTPPPTAPSAATPRPSTATTRPGAATHEAPEAAPPPSGGPLAIPDGWLVRAPIVADLVRGEAVEIQESWSIGMLGDDGLAGLGVRSRLGERAAAYAAGSARLADHDPQESLAGTSMSARVGDVSIRLSTPAFFPGQLHVDANVGVTTTDVIAQCSRLAPLRDELAALAGWPTGLRDCARTRFAAAPDWAHVRLATEEGPALTWLQAHGFVETPSEGGAHRGRVFERGGEARAQARWHVSERELEIVVGDEDAGLEE